MLTLNEVKIFKDRPQRGGRIHFRPSAFGEGTV